MVKKKIIIHGSNSKEAVQYFSLKALWAFLKAFLKAFFKETLLLVEAQAELSFESSFAFDTVVIWTNPSNYIFKLQDTSL